MKRKRIVLVSKGKRMVEALCEREFRAMIDSMSERGDGKRQVLKHA